ncbi:hypothetical protein niasHT_002657 [Heterodera trifolii]|uniref:Uncharacterized protein n=1 Tax=Heterodera trifolii TaxID=157864 RepID=A0ABD2MER4_9BILA
MKRQKIKYPVRYPEFIDLTPYTTTHRNAIVSGDQQQLRKGSSRRHLTSLTNRYSLFAVVNHNGTDSCNDQKITWERGDKVLSSEGRVMPFPLAMRYPLSALCRRHSDCARPTTYVPRRRLITHHAGAVVPSQPIASLLKKLPGHKSPTDFNRRLDWLQAASVPFPCQGADPIWRPVPQFRGSHFGTEPNECAASSPSGGARPAACFFLSEKPPPHVLLLVDLLQLVGLLVYVKRASPPKTEREIVAFPLALRCPLSPLRQLPRVHFPTAQRAGDG